MRALRPFAPSAGPGLSEAVGAFVSVGLAGLLLITLCVWLLKTQRCHNSELKFYQLSLPSSQFCTPARSLIADRSWVRFELAADTECDVHVTVYHPQFASS